MVLIHLADGFEEIEAISVVDVLRRAEIEVKTVSIMGKKEVLGAHNISVIADVLYEDVDYAGADMIILPGGQPGADNLNRSDELKKQIRGFYQQGKMLAAICAAPLVFGNTGILKGKRATCYPGYEKQLTGATYTNADIEIDNNIITGKGPGVALKFSLILVEKLLGKGKADEIKKAMIFT